MWKEPYIRRVFTQRTFEYAYFRWYASYIDDRYALLTKTLNSFGENVDRLRKLTTSNRSGIKI